MKKLLKNNGLSLILIAAAVIWGFSQMAGLPDLMPTHFDFQGNPNQYQSKYFALFFMPAAALFVTFILGFVARISPEGYKMPDSENTAAKFNAGITIFMLVMYVGMIRAGVEPHVFRKFILPDFAFFMIFVGNYFGKLERNFFIGIRVPWAIASPENWKRTHRFAGRVFVVAGIGALLVWLLQGPMWSVFIFLCAAMVLCIGYSYYYFNKYERQNGAN